jgi:hypothetical protein
VRDELRREGSLQVAGLQFGDEFAVRYVPQSRYFQAQELEVSGYTLSSRQLQRLNASGELSVTRRVEIPGGTVQVEVSGDAQVEHRVGVQ